ncbi:peptidoglycan-binding protein [Mesorhizobium sp. BH1-1-5]|uniref:peptidoglycan-binding domain-containing protein n=1 Tax=Mesorhizobium sp. BH1-1-5 TaxID=2876661 RepID=UPI001CCEAFDD|nr:peptidoglycan-binding protein [Mesorhizobium sp. BH1-1-5]MBZ9985655.1 peptidoglycan-binding protein [Mesorhizobium sp. BH1-1-5]
MDKTVPSGAAMLLAFIGGIEAPHGFDTVYGNNQAKLAKPLTSMTIDEVIAAGPRWTRSFGSSAAGFLQFMRATLLRLKKKLRLSGKELLDGPMQMALGHELLKERGFDEFMAGSKSRTAFGLGLAQEWASFPVLTPTVKGAGKAARTLKRGQSYYAGDGLNKALVAPERVEAMLDKLKAPAAAPAPVLDVAAVTAPDKATVERVQQQLKDLGYTEVGGVDGKVGTMTATAIRAFRADNGLPAGDGIDDDMLLALQKARPRTIAPERANAAPEVVRDKVPEVKANWLSKVGGYIVGIPAAAGALLKGSLDNIPVARDYIDPLTSIASDVPGWVWLAGIAGIAGALVLVSRHGEAKGVEAFQTGARR